MPCFYRNPSFLFLQPCMEECFCHHRRRRVFKNPSKSVVQLTWPEPMCWRCLVSSSFVAIPPEFSRHTICDPICPSTSSASPCGIGNTAIRLVENSGYWYSSGGTCVWYRYFLYGTSISMGRMPPMLRSIDRLLCCFCDLCADC